MVTFGKLTMFYGKVKAKFAGTSGNRTQPSMCYMDANGFEDRGGHQCPIRPHGS